MKRLSQHSPAARSLFLLLAMSLAAGGVIGCSGGNESQSSDSEADLTARVHAELAKSLERDLPLLLEAAAVSRVQPTRITDVVSREAAEPLGYGLRYPELVDELYARRDHRPLWVQQGAAGVALSPAGEAVMRVFEQGVSAHGLWADELRIEALLGATSDGVKGREGADSLAEQGWMLDAYERAELARWLEARQDPSQEEGKELVAAATQKDGPLARFDESIELRANYLQAESRRATELDVLLSDNAAHWALRMRFGNDAWLRRSTWPSHLQEPAGDDDSHDGLREASGEPPLKGAELLEARRHYAVVEALAPAFEQPSTAADTLEGLVPPYRQYERLSEAFRQYEAVVRRGGWPELPSAAEGLKAGQTHEYVSTLKARLKVEGYWDGDTDQTFSRALRRAVLDYQRTHQLWENGWLTPQTMRSMNVTAMERWHQIRLALQRWRETRVGPDDHYVHVNIPDFHAEVWRDGERDLRFKVVTGSTRKERNEKTDELEYARATPRFSATLRYIVFNPYWNVPRSIRYNELEPKLAEDPTYYEENNYEVVVEDNGYEFVRQKPGPDNALGAVKFLFPNEHSVYLHDTPDKHLFAHPMRAYSHGCVRIENPMGFAHYLLDLDGRLDDEERRQEKLDEYYAKDTETWFTLRRPLPIHLEYFVVRVDDQGHANFLADLYRLDRPREAIIRERVAANYPELFEASGQDQPAEEHAQASHEGALSP